ncbi:MAG: hypothetical protein Q8R33_01770 [Burkholderiales bacterium]|nr:hypothetical protein [Burkholderiales bacterium]
MATGVSSASSAPCFSGSTVSALTGGFGWAPHPPTRRARIDPAMVRPVPSKMAFLSVQQQLIEELGGEHLDATTCVWDHLMVNNV